MNQTLTLSHFMSSDNLRIHSFVAACLVNKMERRRNLFFFFFLQKEHILNSTNHPREHKHILYNHWHCNRLKRKYYAFMLNESVKSTAFLISDSAYLQFYTNLCLKWNKTNNKWWKKRITKRVLRRSYQRDFFFSISRFAYRFRTFTSTQLSLS